MTQRSIFPRLASASWPAAIKNWIEKEAGQPVDSFTGIDDPDFDGIVLFFGENQSAARVLTTSERNPFEGREVKGIYLYDEMCFSPPESKDCFSPEDAVQMPFGSKMLWLLSGVAAPYGQDEELAKLIDDCIGMSDRAN